MATPAEALALEAELKSFLGEATQAYAAGAMTEYVPNSPHFSNGALFQSGEFRILDEWSQSEDNRIYTGIETVGKSGTEIWQAGYRGVVRDDADPDEVLGFYAEALRQPAQELPIRGPRHLQIGDKVYTLHSLRGPLSVARFAVTDQIHQNGRRIYDGNIHGGWKG